MAEKLKISGILRRLAIAGWLLIALAYLAFFLTDLQLDFVQLQTPCQEMPCNWLALSQAEVNALGSLGMSSLVYSIIVNGASLLAVAASCIIGGLIFWRRGDSLLGWTVSLALITIPVSMIADPDNVAAHFPGLLLPAVFLSLAGIAVLELFLNLFPNGRWYPRWAVVPATITFLAFSVYVLGFNGLVALPGWFPQLASQGSAILFLLAGGFQIQRYRKVSTPLERQQTKWIMLGICILVLSFPTWFLLFGGWLDIPPGSPRLAASLVGHMSIMLAISALPATTAIAIMRYRLWDIDLVIRRTLQYALLTAVIALIYFGGVVLLEGLLRPLAGESRSPLTTVLITLGIAALFNPLRLRTQDFIDRRFFRQKYDAEQVLARFAAAARDEVDLEALSAALVSAADEAMQPDGINLWLK